MTKEKLVPLAVGLLMLSSVAFVVSYGYSLYSTNLKLKGERLQITSNQDVLKKIEEQDPIQIDTLQQYPIDLSQIKIDLPKGDNIVTAKYNKNDGNYYVLINHSEGDEQSFATRISLWNPKTLQTKEIIKTGDKSGDNSVGYIGNILLDETGTKLYFSSNYGGPGTNLVMYDLQNRTMGKKWCAGSPVALFPNKISDELYKQYQGEVLVYDHKYFGIGGAYDFLWAVNPNTCSVSADPIADSFNKESIESMFGVKLLE